MGLWGCSGIHAAGSHPPVFVSFAEGHSSSFHAGKCAQPRLLLCVPSAPGLPACSLPPLTQPIVAGNHFQSNTPVLGLQETCWPCSSGCSLLSQPWPSCCTSTSTAARTHGEQRRDAGGQGLGGRRVQGMRMGFNGGFRQQDPVLGLTLPPSFFPHQAGLANQIQGHLHGSQH